MASDQDSPPARPVARKRPHTKAKSGCIQCKARKIKCDEGKPACSRCVRYSENCEYRQQPPSAPRLSPECKTSSAPAASPDLDLTDLGLLHHWTLSAYSGFGNNPGDEQVWQKEVPHMALQYPFLMHGILAVSALHLARLNPHAVSSYVVKAAEHQVAGLAVYRRYLANGGASITQDNCHSIVAFGALTIAYVFALPENNMAPSLSPSPHWRGTLNWVLLLRSPGGLCEAKATMHDWVLKGPMAYQLRSYRDTAPDSQVPPDLPALIKLEALFQSTDPQAAINRQVHASLISTYASTGIIGHKLALYRWAHAFPAGYLDLLCRLEPVAMVLLAHLCVLIKLAADTHWFMEGLAEQTLAIIDDSLPPQMRTWLEWPRDMIYNSRSADELLPSLEK